MIFNINNQISVPIVRFSDNMYPHGGTVIAIVRHVNVVLEAEIAKTIEDKISDLMLMNEFSLSLERDGKEIWSSTDFNSFDSYSFNVGFDDEDDSRKTLTFSIKKEE